MKFSSWNYVIKDTVEVKYLCVSIKLRGWSSQTIGEHKHPWKMTHKLWQLVTSLQQVVSSQVVLLFKYPLFTVPRKWMNIFQALFLSLHKFSRVRPWLIRVCFLSQAFNLYVHNLDLKCHYNSLFLFYFHIFISSWIILILDIMHVSICLGCHYLYLVG